MRRQLSTASIFPGTLGALMLATASARGQGPVSGQVSIQERPGEQTEDLGNTVIYLDAPASKVKAQPINESFSIQGRNILPHVRIVPAGSKLEFVNQDPFSHNVFTKATQGPFDTDVFGRNKKKSATVK